MSSSTLNNEEEGYIDYSCSTPVERLARDVEMVLQSWHVTNGSDRHVSLLNPDAADERNDSVSKLHASSSSGSLASSTNAANIKQVEQRLIRSERITWDCSSLSDASSSFLDAHDDLSGVRVQLQLSLWDAPPSSRSQSQHEQLPSESNIDDQAMKMNDSGLPYSLDRPVALEAFPSDLFRNISSLFGIGQYITLSLSADDFDEECSSSNNNELMLLQSLLLETATGVLERHASTRVVMTVLQNIWSNWLQTALNMAVSSCQCAMPVFGMWAKYNGDGVPMNITQQDVNYSSIMWWKPLRDILTAEQETTSNSSTDDTGVNEAAALWRKIQQNYYRARRRITPQLEVKMLNVRQVPPICNGQLCSSGSCATFTLSVVPFDKERYSLMHLSTWGDLLMTQANVSEAALWGAKHAYSWKKPQRDPKYQAMDDWRGDHSTDCVSGLHESARTIDIYRQENRNLATMLLEDALGASAKNPMWGPVDDPIASVRVETIWNGIQHRPSPGSPSTAVDPLLSFPLKTRSRQMSESDWKEMQESVEGMILDPHRSSLFKVLVEFDSETPHASLATTMRCILAALIRSATLPPETLCSHLIDIPLIQGWDNIAGNLVAQSLAEAANVCPATQALVAAMDWANAATDMIDATEAYDIVRRLFDDDFTPDFPAPPDNSPKLTPRQSLCFRNAAPPGRLLSLLFMHMARVRSPSSIALVWNVVVQELRERWENKENIPNMKFALGLDPIYERPKTKQRFSVCKSVAAVPVTDFVQDPDNSYCLIGQKLQVLNICVATASVVNHHTEHSEKRPRLASSIESPLSTSLLSGDSDNEEFFDAFEGEHDLTISNDKNGSVTQKSSSVSRLTSAKPFREPILQRAYPLTDDVISERKIMIAKQDSGFTTDLSSQKLELIHRFQRPKLLSDMQAFKASNPDVVFDDFVAWYGGPADPLPEYRDDEPLSASSRSISRRRSSRANSMMETAEELDKAADSIRALNATRVFWQETWNAAEPRTVADQEPLFDAVVMAEMALDYLDTIHPANLLCQIMAANLNAAYFALVSSAGVAMQIGAVSRVLQELRETSETVIKLLSSDVLAAATASRSRSKRSLPTSIASIDTLASCERACALVGESEVIVSRAISLLNKLPGQFDLIENLLRNPEGSWVSVTPETSRNAVLHAMASQQPEAREYMIRGQDPLSPCQLCVSYGPANSTTDNWYPK
ncbi:hypothetical protein MPSEU_000589000 [Mayamaea pseudoterrestris]|nr:hypothetical protein MPSEU_000589000 [Mayamaea pseudoterrestris]